MASQAIWLFTNPMEGLVPAITQNGGVSILALILRPDVDILYLQTAAVKKQNAGPDAKNQTEKDQNGDDHPIFSKRTPCLFQGVFYRNVLVRPGSLGRVDASHPIRLCISDH